MDNKTLIGITRICAGTAIFITHMVTGYNGSAQILALVLLGVPVENLKK